MFCKKCGARNNEEDKYCHSCGERIKRKKIEPFFIYGPLILGGTGLTMLSHNDIFLQLGFGGAFLFFLYNLFNGGAEEKKVVFGTALSIVLWAVIFTVGICIAYLLK